MILPGRNEFLANYTEKNRKYYIKILTRFRIYLQSVGLKSFSSVKRIHLRNFFIELNKEQWRKSTKEKKFQCINLYVKFLFEYDYLDHQLSIKKPKFTDYISKQILSQLSLKLPSPQDIKFLLEHAKKVHEKMFILMGLLVHNGMRISECVSILIENVDLNNRTIISGLLKNAAKEGFCYYFIPKKLVNPLQNYILELKRIYRNPVFLFPGKTRTGYITTQNASRNIKKYSEILIKLGKIQRSKVNSHAFRHALNHERLKMGCNDSLMAILLNQVPRGTNAIYYLEMVKNDLNTRKIYWDQFTPDYL